jgi:ATP/maltotriose-dependent transcriptional regulator MalT
MPDFTPHQQNIIQRYYSNQDTIQRQRLAELVTELYLAEAGRRGPIWKRAAAAMKKLGVPATRIEHVTRSGDPALLAQVVKELEAK